MGSQFPEDTRALGPDKSGIVRKQSSQQFKPHFYVAPTCSQHCKYGDGLGFPSFLPKRCEDADAAPCEDAELIHLQSQIEAQFGPNSVMAPHCLTLMSEAIQTALDRPELLAAVLEWLGLRHDKRCWNHQRLEVKSPWCSSRFRIS